MVRCTGCNCRTQVRPERGGSPTIAYATQVSIPRFMATASASEPGRAGQPRVMPTLAHVQRPDSMQARPGPTMLYA